MTQKIFLIPVIILSTEPNQYLFSKYLSYLPYYVSCYCGGVSPSTIFTLNLTQSQRIKGIETTASFSLPVAGITNRKWHPSPCSQPHAVFLITVFRETIPVIWVCSQEKNIFAIEDSSHPVHCYQKNSLKYFFYNFTVLIKISQWLDIAYSLKSDPLAPPGFFQMFFSAFSSSPFTLLQRFYLSWPGSLHSPKLCMLFLYLRMLLCFSVVIKSYQ